MTGEYRLKWVRKRQYEDDEEAMLMKKFDHAWASLYSLGDAIS